MRRSDMLALVVLSACGGHSATDRAADAGASGGTAGGSGAAGSSGTDGSDGTAGNGGLAGSDAGEAGECLAFGAACDGVTLCCDGTQCTCEGCGIDPACVSVGSVCDAVCAQCCNGQCENGVCVGPLDCPTTIDDYCASNPCVTTWPSDQTAFCPILSTYGATSTGACNGYLGAFDQGVDIRISHYFDASTGALVAILRYWWDGSLTCLAGPSTFEDPSCSGDANVDCSDAGTP